MTCHLLRSNDAYLPKLSDLLKFTVLFCGAVFISNDSAGDDVQFEVDYDELIPQGKVKRSKGVYPPANYHIPHFWRWFSFSQWRVYNLISGHVLNQAIWITKADPSESYKWRSWDPHLVGPASGPTKLEDKYYPQWIKNPENIKYFDRPVWHWSLVDRSNKLPHFRLQT